jgi:DNA-binding transcriptional MerR regulator
VTGAAAATGNSHGESLMSIGEVLAHLRTDFPDTTISKLRFLETEGLVEPRRTAAGYRKYSWQDVARLRYVLTAQRDQYLPLRVIREQLAAFDDEARATPVTRAEQPTRYDEPPTRRVEPPTRLRPALQAVAGEPAPAEAAPSDLRLTREELIDRAGLTEPALVTLEQAGLIAERPGGGYDADALEIAAVAALLGQYGLEARHLRAYRAAADREIGLFTQLVAPLARQSGPAARARAAETVRELAACTERLHAALVRSGLRQTLGR